MAEHKDVGDVPAAENPPRLAARDLTRRRTRKAALPETGRVHHLGLPPAAQPVHTETGVDWTAAADVRLRALTDMQLDELATRLREQVRAASDRLEYERAAELLAELRSVERHRASRA